MMPILVIGAVIAVALAVVLVRKARTPAAWTGRVESLVRSTACREECAQTLVIVRYRTDGGRKGKFKLEEGACARYFPGLQAGDRLVKTEDEALPRRV
jgi:hypothetical protein